MSSWYLVHTKIRQERIACENLQRQGYECYFPLARSDQPHDGAVQNHEQALFPRCFFVRMSAELASARPSPVLSTKGVSRLLSHGQTPLKISDELLANVLAQTESAVRAETTCSMTSAQERVIALLNTLGRQITTPMPTTVSSPRAIGLG